MSVALMMIDFQKGIDFPSWGQRSTPEMEKVVRHLFSFCRDKAIPIIHIKHDSVLPASPYRPGQVGNDFKDCAQPMGDEKIFIKHTNNAFVKTGLDDYLKSQGITKLYMGGTLLEHCVGLAAKHAACLDYDVTLISDAVASVEQTNGAGHLSADQIKAFLLENFIQDYGSVVTSDEFCKKYN